MSEVMEGIGITEIMVMGMQKSMIENWATIKVVTKQKIKTRSEEHLLFLQYQSQLPLIQPTIQIHWTYHLANTASNLQVPTKI